MESIEKLVRQEDHALIVEMEGEEYNVYKCVALIKLERYKEAIKYAKSLPFELAYINYKLKKFRRSLKIIENVGSKDTKFEVLKSQVLYKLGRYYDAYSVLKECSLYDDEFFINLESMRSLGIFARNCLDKVPSSFSLAKGDPAANFEESVGNRAFRNMELEEEFKYNETFRHLSNADLYIGALRKLGKKYSSGLVRRQLDNVLGNFEKINPAMLEQQDREVLKFNMGEIDSFLNPVHYQKNFHAKVGTFWPAVDYLCYRKAQEMKYMVFRNAVPASTGNLRLLNAFLNLKRMFGGAKFTRRYFPEKASESMDWELVRFLAMRNMDLASNQEAVLCLISKFD